MPRGWGRGVGPRRIRRFLEPALLLSLHHRPAHGYALAEGLGALGLESYPTDTSCIYRILYDLEAKGMLVSQREAEGSAGPPRKVYSLTEEGDAYLQQWIKELRETDRLLHRFLEAYESHRREHELETKDAARPQRNEDTPCSMDQNAQEKSQEDDA